MLTKEKPSLPCFFHTLGARWSPHAHAMQKMQVV